jgi:hypothetical protein
MNFTGLERIQAVMPDSEAVGEEVADKSEYDEEHAEDGAYAEARSGGTLV